MDDRDWTQNRSFQFECSGPTEPPGKVRRHHQGPVLALLALLLAIAAITGCCLAFGMSLRFNRFDSGFSLTFEDNAAATQLQSSGNALSPDSFSGQTLPDTADNLSAAPDQQTASSDAAAPSDYSSSTPVEALSPQDAGETLSLRQIYILLSPSVVSIQATDGYSTSSGSGFVISEDGYIATNAHVVSSMPNLSVTLHDGASYTAELVGADAVSDLAVLKIHCTGLTPVSFGDSDALYVGDAVVAIGDPLGFELRGTMTNGIISAINRDLQVDGRTMTLLQTNAALNEGNSGGPLINLQGQVIGINTIKLSSSYTSIEGLGFAIPSATAMPILTELMQKGYISGRPDLGFDGITVPTYAQFYYRLPAGVYIEQIDADSDAAEQGLQPGDVVTRADDQSITGLEDLERVKNAHIVGDTIELIIYRRGIYYSLQLTLGEASPD